MHRLRAAGELVEIREPALGFTADETADLLAGDGLHISGEDLAALVDRTEGWAVALRLAAGFLADSRGGRTIADFAGDVVGVADYLTDEVLRGQPSPIRRFLLYTSICESVCGELTDAITLDSIRPKTPRGMGMCQHFVVRLGPKPQRFRYHHLVRDALRTGRRRRPRRWCRSCTNAQPAETPSTMPSSRPRGTQRVPGTGRTSVG